MEILWHVLRVDGGWQTTKTSSILGSKFHKAEARKMEDELD